MFASVGLSAWVRRIVRGVVRPVALPQAAPLLCASVLLALLASGSTSATARPAAGVGVRVSLSVEGRSHEIDAFGRLTQSGGRRPNAMAVVLQQRVFGHGGSLWRTRATARARRRGHSLTYVLRWRQPPSRARVTVRVLAERGHRILGVSPVQDVRSGDP